MEEIDMRMKKLKADLYCELAGVAITRNEFSLAEYARIFTFSLSDIADFPIASERAYRTLSECANIRLVFGSHHPAPRSLGPCPREGRESVDLLPRRSAYCRGNGRQICSRLGSGRRGCFADWADQEYPHNSGP